MQSSNYSTRARQITSSMCNLIKEICKPLKSYTHHTLIDHEAIGPLPAMKLHYNHSLSKQSDCFHGMDVERKLT